MDTEFGGKDGEAAFRRVLMAAGTGDQDAFALLYRHWNPPLVRYLAAQAPEVAEDLSAEVWITAASTIRSFTGNRAAWRSWLFTLAHRRLIDYRRQTARRRTDPEPATAFSGRLAPDDPAQEVTDRLSSAQAIARLVAVLNEEQAEVLLLRIVAGLSAAEVGEVLGRPDGWVRVTQHRALAKLSKLGIDRTES